MYLIFFIIVLLPWLLDNKKTDKIDYIYKVFWNTISTALII